MAKTFRQISRIEYESTSQFYDAEQVRIGALQRIADATEAMAKNHNDLLRDVKLYKDMYQNQTMQRQQLERSNAALRGQITKLRKKLNAK